MALYGYSENVKNNLRRGSKGTFYMLPVILAGTAVAISMMAKNKAQDAQNTTQRLSDALKSSDQENL